MAPDPQKNPATRRRARPAVFIALSPEERWRRAVRRRFALDCLGLALVLTVALLLYATWPTSGSARASALNDAGTTALGTER
jgi:hypothetical protein